MKLTINIADNSLSKVLPLIEYLKSFDFISIEKEEVSSLSNEQIQILEERRLNSKKEDYQSWEELEKLLTFAD